MDNYIVGLLGMSKVGKDEIGKIFVQHNYKRYAFGDLVKEEVANNLNIEVEDLHNHNKEKYRNFLINHGESMRESNKNYWIEKIENKISEDVKLSNIIITDIRRIAEIDYIQKIKKKYPGKVFLIQVERPLSAGGIFDMDSETSKALLYAQFYNFIDIKFINNYYLEDMPDIVDGIMAQIETT